MKSILLLALTISISTGCDTKKAVEPAMDEAAMVEKAANAAADADQKAKAAASAEKTAAGEPVQTPPSEIADGDYIKVIAMHEPKKEGDPVVVEFSSFSVTDMAFDPNALVGGTATLEIDLGSLSSGSSDRDAHLKTPDFLNVPKMPTAVVKVKVDKKNGKKYMGTATVNAHGEKAQWPISFEVVKQMDDGVVVKASHEFKRSDLKVGAPPSKDMTVADKLILEMQLTLQNT